MPMEMPTNVSPVRTGRRCNPRTMMVKKFMLGFGRGWHLIGQDLPVLHLDDTRGTIGYC